MESIVFAYDTALAYWNRPKACMPRQALGHFSSSLAVMYALKGTCADTIAAACASPVIEQLPHPVDILVPSAERCWQSKHAIRHLESGLLPAMSIVDIGTANIPGADDYARMFVSTPEFCFLQMARLVDDWELIEIGFELCGRYAIAPLSEMGLIKRQPVTTVDRLHTFVESAKSMRGVSRARRALKWVLDNSWSPKETQIAMLMSMSRACCGFGVPAPQLNNRIEVVSDVARVLNGHELVPDMHWPQIRTVGEYNSDLVHLNRNTASHDSRKRNAYKLMGLDTIDITYDQFSDFETMQALCLDLIRRFGIRRRPTTAAQRANQRELHQWLLHGKRRERLRGYSSASK